MLEAIFKMRLQKWDKALKLLEANADSLHSTEQDAINTLRNLWRNTQFGPSCTARVERMVKVLSDNDKLHGNNRDIVQASKDLRGVAKEMYTTDAETFSQFAEAMKALHGGPHLTQQQQQRRADALRRRQEEDERRERLRREQAERQEQARRQEVVRQERQRRQQAATAVRRPASQAQQPSPHGRNAQREDEQHPMSQDRRAQRLAEQRQTWEEAHRRQQRRAWRERGLRYVVGSVLLLAVCVSVLAVWQAYTKVERPNYQQTLCGAWNGEQQGLPATLMINSVQDDSIQARMLVNTKSGLTTTQLSGHLETEREGTYLFLLSATDSATYRLLLQANGGDIRGLRIAGTTHEAIALSKGRMTPSNRGSTASTPTKKHEKRNAKKRKRSNNDKASSPASTASEPASATASDESPGFHLEIME